MTGIDFGNDDPEDAWDDGDPLPLRLALFIRIAAHIYAEFTTEGVTPRHAARVAGLARLAGKLT